MATDVSSAPNVATNQANPQRLDRLTLAAEAICCHLGRLQIPTYWTPNERGETKNVNFMSVSVQWYLVRLIQVRLG